MTPGNDPFFFIELQEGEIKPRLVAKAAKFKVSTQVVVTNVHNKKSGYNIKDRAIWRLQHHESEN
jgi:hypothetical protein